MISANEGGLNRIQDESQGGIRLHLAGFVRFPPGRRGERHSHPFWELIFIGEGQGELSTGEASTPCSSNDLLLFRPGESHQFRAIPENAMEHSYLGFSFDFAPPELLQSRFPRTLPPGPLSDLIRSELKSIHAHARRSGKAGAFEPLRFRLLQVAGRVVDLLTGPYRSRDERNRDAKESLVESIKDHLAANPGARVSVPALARHFCLSPKYFGEIFKKRTGLSIREYLNDIRMARAMERIRDGETSVADIAEGLGFSDSAYFSRLFRMHHRMSPRQARGHRGRDEHQGLSA